MRIRGLIPFASSVRLRIIGGILLVSMFILISLVLYISMIYGKVVNPDMLMISSSVTDRGGLELNGSTSSSAAAYSGYSYEVKDGKLMIQVRYVPVANRWHSAGDFRIRFSENELKGVRQVYLYGEGGDGQLIWNKD